MKHYLSFLLLILICSLDANSKPNKLTPSITWELRSDGTLEILGTGSMPDFANSKESQKWLKKSIAKKITHITVGEGITKIGDHSFDSGLMLYLESVSLPSTLRVIGEEAFAHCRFENIVIPQSVVSIGSGAFRGCINLESITIPNGVKKIGPNTFANCRRLKSINLSNVESIGDKAFTYTDLDVIIIPSTINHLGKSIFYESNLKTAVFEEGINISAVPDECFCFCKNLLSIKMPEKIKEIGERAFWGCSSLQDWTPFQNIEVFKKESFGCCNFETFQTGSKVRRIEDEMLYANHDLHYFYIPENPRVVIGSQIFKYDYHIYELRIPSNAVLKKDSYSGSFILRDLSDFEKKEMISNPRTTVLSNYYYEAEIINIPDNVTLSNCSDYGLSYKSVYSYFEQHHPDKLKAYKTELTSEQKSIKSTESKKYSGNNKTQSCPSCMGTGRCPLCNGAGSFYGVPCVSCGGTGRCASCRGSGQVANPAYGIGWNSFIPDGGTSYQGGSIDINTINTTQSTPANGKSGSSTGTGIPCSRCNGTGRIEINTYPPTFGTDDPYVKCNECGKSFLRSMGHAHQTCPQCHGHKYL